MMTIDKPTEELLDTINALNTRDKKYTPNKSYMATSAETQEEIHGDDRRKMADWCYSITDYYYGNGEHTAALAIGKTDSYGEHTAALAIGITDSYLTKARQDTNLVNIFQDKDQYQLLCMTSLSLSSKTNQDKPFDNEDIAGLSRGKFSANDIVQFESNLLQASGWNLSPPTPYEYFEALAPTIFNGDEAAIKNARTKIKEPLKQAIIDPSQINVRVVDKFYNAMSEVLKSSRKARIIPSLNSALTDRGTLAEEGKLADPKSRIQQRNSQKCSRENLNLQPANFQDRPKENDKKRKR